MAIKTHKVCGHYETTVEMIVDDKPKTISIYVTKNEETGLWYGVMSGISDHGGDEYTDHYPTKRQVLTSIESIKGWKHYKGLGWCITN